MSALAVLKAHTSGGLPFYYKGESGRRWLCIEAADALAMPLDQAEREAERLNSEYQEIGVLFQPVIERYAGAVLIYRGVANWDVYLMPNGRLYSIPNAAGRRRGAADSYYGDRYHLLGLMREGYFNNANYTTFTEAGLEYMEGLSCSIAPRGLVYFR